MIKRTIVWIMFITLLVGCQQIEENVIPEESKNTIVITPASQIKELETTNNEVISPVDNEKTIMQELLEKIPRNHWFYEDGKNSILVSGNKRAIGTYNPQVNFLYNLKYWDTKTKEFYILSGHIAESWWAERNKQNYVRKDVAGSNYLPAFLKLKLTGNKAQDKYLIPKEFNKYWVGTKEDELITLIEEFYFKSPVDWMQEYAKEKPVSVDTKKQTIQFFGKMKESPLHVRYKNLQNPLWNTVFIFARTKTNEGYEYFFPMIINIISVIDEKTVKTIRYDMDTIYYDPEKVKDVPVTEKITELPKGSIVVTTKDMDEWLKQVKKR